MLLYVYFRMDSYTVYSYKTNVISMIMLPLRMLFALIIIGF